MPSDDSVGVQVVGTYRVGMKQILPIWILFFINLFNYIDRYIVSGLFSYISFYICRRLHDCLTEISIINNDIYDVCSNSILIASHHIDKANHLSFRDPRKIIGRLWFVVFSRRLTDNSFHRILYVFVACLWVFRYVVIHFYRPNFRLMIIICLSLWFWAEPLLYRGGCHVRLCPLIS